MVVAHKHRISVGLGNAYKNGSRCVRIRVTYAGDRIDLYTTLSATEKQWDSKWKSPVCVTPEAQVPLTLESKFRMTPIKS